MIPVLHQGEDLETRVRDYLDALAGAGFEGDIDARFGTRLLMATDNSIYQVVPQAVVFPAHHDDVLTLLRVANRPAFQGLRLVPRGGGTGTNGQALSAGIVVDMSRHMTRILEVNAREGWARVEAGVIKDALNDAVRDKGLFFAPDLSTSNRATVGGMINTDASGQGSLLYGKTSDHVLGLRCVLADGTTLETRPQALELARASADPRMDTLLHITDRHADLIEKKFPDLNRFMTGYDLMHARQGEQVDLGRLICGSEGTLALVTEAKVRLTRIPADRALLVIRYRDFDAALRHAPELVAARALSVETVDARVLDAARRDPIWHQVRAWVGEGGAGGMNLVEFAGEADEFSPRLEALIGRLEDADAAVVAGVSGFARVVEGDAIERLYAMRKKAVGLLGKPAQSNGTEVGRVMPTAFVEDSCVPPQHLADYIAEFRALLEGHGLTYAMFGHVDSGVLHVRPMMDLCDPAQASLVREISDAVVALTQKYGGLLWGEHGRGYRAAYGPEYFGEELYTQMCRIKSVFDPDNRLNPGKIASPLETHDPLVDLDHDRRHDRDREVPAPVRARFASAMDCNGNGQCFSYDNSAVMCPSYRATGDRRHSPKGRAALLREWLRRLGEEGDTLTASMKSPAKGGRYRPARWPDDFSHEVMEVMRGCLACKACTTACPVNVDIPSLRARFFALYHQRYRRSTRDQIIAGSESAAALMARVPRWLRRAWENPINRAFMKRAYGLVDLPQLAPRSLPRLLGRRHPALTFDARTLSALPDAHRSRVVVIVQDVFTRHFDPHVPAALVRLVERLGYEPVLHPLLPIGKAAHVTGFLDRFEQTARETAKRLETVHRLGLTLVGLDPAMVLCLRDEYRDILGAERGEFEVLLPQEWLKTVDVPADRLKKAPRPYPLFLHCTEKALLPEAGGDWQAAFERFGARADIRQTGCCGMAGTYGHEREHQLESRQLYEASWRGGIERSLDPLVTGFSCRDQTHRLSRMRPRHPVEALLDLLG